MVTRPVSGMSNVERIRIKVDLPELFAPTKQGAWLLEYFGDAVNNDCIFCIVDYNLDHRLSIYIYSHRCYFLLIRHSFSRPKIRRQKTVGLIFLLPVPTVEGVSF